MTSLQDFMSGNKASNQEITNTAIDKIPQPIIDMILVHLSPKQCFLFELAMDDFLQRKNLRNLTIEEENMLQHGDDESDEYYDSDEYCDYNDDYDYYNQNNYKCELDDGWIDPNPNIDYNDGSFL